MGTSTACKPKPVLGIHTRLLTPYAFRSLCRRGSGKALDCPNQRCRVDADRAKARLVQVHDKRHSARPHGKEKRYENRVASASETELIAHRPDREQRPE